MTSTSTSTSAGPSAAAATSGSVHHEDHPPQPPPAKRQRREHDCAAPTTASAEVNGDGSAEKTGGGGGGEGKGKKQRVPVVFRSEAYEAALSQPFPVCVSPPDYARGLFLAPMVRIGTLPTRLLSLRYGADLVWGPEIVDRAIMAAERKVDPRTGLVDFLKDGKSVFSTHPVEKSRLIFQLGSASPAQAYEAIRVVADDVAGVDLNCGCPKPFSTSGGMGANLLTTPDILCNVLRAMRHAAPPHVAVTCKIRLLPTQEDTIRLVRQIVQTGVINAITIHCRTKEMRPREPALLHRFREVAAAIKDESQGRLPIVVNGDCWSAEDEAKHKELTGASSIMMARGAELNPSVFRREGKLSVPDIVAPEYVRYAMYFNNPWGNTKYCLGQLNFKDRANFEHEHAGDQRQDRTHDSEGDGGDIKHMTRSELIKLRETVMSCTTYAQMAAAFGLDYESECVRVPEDMLAEVALAVARLNERPRGGGEGVA
ncbi:tRNA-dihydrouridine synthase 2 [Tilletia horrida]|nr:tRNA-dihydrouridine synthase 2 [Tilletia horrida]